MNAWIYVILGIIGLVALGKVVYLIVQKRQTSTTTSVRQTTQAATVEKPNLNETGPMIYYAMIIMADLTGSIASITSASMILLFKNIPGAHIS